MKRNKIRECYLRILSEMYNKAEPPLDFMEIWIDYELHDIQPEKEWYEKHFLDMEKQDEIYEKHIKNYKFTKREKGGVKMALLNWAPRGYHEQ